MGPPCNLQNCGCNLDCKVFFRLCRNSIPRFSEICTANRIYRRPAYLKIARLLEFYCHPAGKVCRSCTPSSSTDQVHLLISCIPNQGWQHFVHQCFETNPWGRALTARREDYSLLPLITDFDIIRCRVSVSQDATRKLLYRHMVIRLL